MITDRPLIAYSVLRWNETELTEFFGVLASYDDGAHSYSFEVSREGLRLLVTIFDAEAVVYVSIFRDGWREPLFTVRRERCTHAHITKGAEFRRCFEAGAPRYPVTDMGVPPLLEWGVRVYIEPQFRVELVEARYDSR